MCAHTHTQNYAAHDQIQEKTNDISIPDLFYANVHPFLGVYN